MTRGISLYNKNRSGREIKRPDGDRSYSSHHNSTDLYEGNYHNPNHTAPSPRLPPLNNNYQYSSTMFSSPNVIGYGSQTQNQNHSGVKTSDPGSSTKLRETIHSGQFMVSDFEPESEVLDEEYEAGMPVPSVTEDDSGQGSFGAAGCNGGPSGGSSESHGERSRAQTVSVITMNQKYASSQLPSPQESALQTHRPPTLGGGTGGDAPKPIIDGSLTKLFQCMSLAYRQKLTSPKWNPFKGVRLRWKDKIRLNNVIWRCWHMQFILRQRAMVCQFASPLDVDQHSKPEAVVMEGKYWKRKLSTVAAEYKKWRLFYRNRIMGWTHHHPVPDLHPVSLDGFDWNRPGTFGNGPMSNIVFDDELLMDFSDTLFSSLSSQPFAFPNPRELSRAGMVADFIQPGLVQLQPNLEDFMDTLEPFHDFVNTKFLPAVPEELDNIDASQDHLLNVDLPNLVQTRMQQTQFSKQTGNQSIDNHQAIYSSRSDNSAAALNFYGMNQINDSRQGASNAGHQSQTTHASASGTLDLKDEYNQSRKNAKNEYSLHSPDDIFAVPKDFPPTLAQKAGEIPSLGKPRGRSRSGNSRLHSSSHHSNFNMTPLTSIPQTSNLGTPTPVRDAKGSNSVSSSHTLLSHLLTTPGHAHYSGGNGGRGIEKTGTGSISSQHLYPPDEQQSGIPLPGSLIDIQQHQQPPWNPKNANDTLTLNFVPKTLAKGNSSGQTRNGGGSTENISRTRMRSTPSPPLGPSSSGPPSSPKVFHGKNDSDRVFQEHRRVCHINAEQKRRCNIKNGFDMLHSLIPQLSHSSNAKFSKAAMLQKGAEYIRQLKVERGKLKQEIEAHRQEVEALNAAINNCQSMLPATGAPVSRQRTNKMKEMFDHWVRMKTLENWRFWLFSILIRPLLDSYNNAVSTSSLDELCRTVLAWIDQHCSLVDLRPAVLNSLRFLCTTTEILTNPGNLPEEANRAVNRLDRNSERSLGGDSDSR